MKSLLFSACFIALFTFKAPAQNHKATIKQIADLLAAATVKSDYATVLNYTYPPILKAHGGKDSVLTAISNGFKRMKEQGTDLVISGASIGEPSDEVEYEHVLYSVMPEHLILTVNGVKYSTTSSLIAFSNDNGKQWYFIDSAGLEGAKTFLPNLNKLNIPAATPPVKITDN